MPGERGLPVLDRLFRHIDRRRADQCWEWTGRRNWQGYGQTKLPSGKSGGRTVMAHRVVFEEFWGVKLQNKALHYCDNPPCCNPFHLYDGTTSDNAYDSVDAGTAVVLRRGWRNTARGERSGNAKLTDEAVRDIRRRYAAGGVSQQALADEYGVNQTKVSDVIRRRTWAHIE